ncbi:MAG: phosphatidate cytidylyltransferase [Syntrophales bacterium]|nr:phosphatidate cytidylyltransferase [Syntrophales bacterium]
MGEQATNYNMRDTSHLKRWLTAIVVLPLVVSVIIFGSHLGFTLLITVLVLLGLHEYQTLVFGTHWSIYKVYVLFAGLLIPLAFYAGNGDIVLAVISMTVIVFFIIQLTNVREDGLDITRLMKSVLGFLYVPLLFSHFIWIRRFDDGVVWVFFVLVLAFSGDVAAFYGGRMFGKNRLAPFISAGKSIEGTVALCIGSVIACVIYSYFLLPKLYPFHAVAIGFVGSVIGQLGDLCESLIKRGAGVKDSGRMLPGHGGVLDRLDCLLFIVPFVYYYKQFVVG